MSPGAGAVETHHDIIEPLCIPCQMTGGGPVYERCVRIYGQPNGKIGEGIQQRENVFAHERFAAADLYPKYLETGDFIDE